MARPVKSVDQLSIEITASAQQASQELERLTKSVQNLSGALSGANIKPFIQDLKSLGSAVKGINTNGLTKDMTKLSTSMGKYIQNTSKLAKINQGGVTAFAQLRRGADGIFGVLQKVNVRVNDFASRIRKANKETKNFAQTIGLLYARFWLLIRGAKGIVNAVKSSMNYIEVLNYFDASFGQVAERGVSQWSEMGYESAEAYYNSFSERAKQVTKDMSGFFPEKDGTLTPTNLASLGMNPQDLMKYQSQFAQMSSSMGTTSEQALLLSEVLTKIGADLASVKNMDFDQVWGDMASGLVGMSRTLDKYGANIRNANMEMKLQELGINATVKSLSQADKALLRTIILLDASKYAWADLAETLNTPANQFRMLANNVKLLGQMIGNIFLPIVAKVLPYINAFVIALQRLFTWLAKILGIDLSKLQATNQGFDNSGISDLLDDSEALSDSLQDDTDNAKKLKKQLQGFDALNNLTTNEDSKVKGLDAGLASGLLNDAFLDAVNNYLKAWQDAFDKLQNRAEEIADKICAFFKRLANPIIEAWKKVGDFVKTSWSRLGQSLKLTFEHIAKDFWRVWEEQETTEIFEHLFYILGNIAEIIRHISNAFREAWDYNENGYRILAGIRDIILIVAKNAHEMSDSVVDWAKKLDLKPLLGKVADYIESLKPVVESLMGVMKDFLDQVLLPLAKWTIEKGLPDLIQVFIDLNKKIKWEELRKKLSNLWDHLEPFAETVGKGLILFVQRIADAIANFVNGETFENFLKKLCDLMDRVTAEDVADALEALVKAIVGLKVALAVFAVVKPIANMILFAKALKTLTVLAGGAKNYVTLGKALGSLGASIGSFVGNLGKNIGASIGSAFASLSRFTGEIQSTLYAIGGKGSVGLAGFWEFLTADVGSLVTSGSMATVGATIATALVGSILSAIAGFKVGKLIGEAIFKDDASWYQNFKWTGEGGFFDSLKYACTEMLPASLNSARDSLNSWFNADVQPLFEVAKWTAICGQMTVGFETAINGIVQLEKDNSFSEWIENDVKPMFSSELWLTLTGGMATGFEETLSMIKTAYENSSFKKWIDNDVKPLFTSAFWTQIYAGMLNGINGILTQIGNKFKNFVSEIKRGINDLIMDFAKLKREANNANLNQYYHSPIRSGSIISGGNRIFANGGFPEDGIFFANHNELVGKFSNGQTAVANNEQIVSGIQNGVYSAMSDSNVLLSEQNELLRAILEKESGISSGALFASVQSSADSYYRQTGRKAFA